MDEDISIINTNTRNEKIKNFFIQNKKKIISGLSFIVILLICYFAFVEYQDRKKIKISDAFNTITINYSESNNEKTAKDLIQIVNEKNSTYSSSDSAKKLHLVSIDGLLGIGASGELRSEYLEAAKEINKLRCNFDAVTFSLDIPSGVDGLTGHAYDDAVIADFTLTIAHPKTGLLQDGAINHVGRIAPIHLPNLHPLPGQGDGNAFLINSFSLEGKLRDKTHDYHKGLNGHVGIIGGNIGTVSYTHLTLPTKRIV